MTIDSILPFLLIVAPFAIAFFVEALVIYFSRIKRFWPALGLSVVINLVTMAVLYGSSLLLAKLGYEFNGLQLPVQVVLFLWWLSVLADGLLLSLFASNAPRKNVYLASIAMNTISYAFLFFFITNSH